MFSAKTYAARRNMLRTKIGSGIVLFPGNPLSPNNYPNNAYYFRQDSSFLYYFGLERPLAGGPDRRRHGRRGTLRRRFHGRGHHLDRPAAHVARAGRKSRASQRHIALSRHSTTIWLRKAISLGRKIHFLPPYRGETKLWLSSLLGITPALLHDYKSVDLMFAVAEMREKKSAEEIEEMERAFQIGYKMHTLAMKMCRPGVVEREIAGAIEGIAKSLRIRACRSRRSSRSTAKRCITSTPTAYWKRDVCCCATRAAKRSTTTAPTTPAPTP